MRPQDRTTARELARLASGAHGVVTREQLLRGGITEGQIRERLRSGALLREHAGVYRVGHRAPNREAHYLAAVLACGPGAALSGLAAAHLLGLLRGPAPAPEVTAPAQRRPAGVVVHRARDGIDTRETTVVHGIPATTPARTLVDVAGALDADRLARACHEAGILHGTTPRQVESVLSRRPTTAGARRLRAILHGDERVTLSTLERRFLERLRAAELPLPQTNRPAGGRRVDCRWHEQRLTVEVDGYRYHRSRHAWERDRSREREAYARGDQFRRYTYGDVLERPGRMLAELHALLAPPSAGNDPDWLSYDAPYEGTFGR